jgi:hypothetical protein
MSDVQRTVRPASAHVGDTTRSPCPGAWMALVSSLLSGWACWVWLMPQLIGELRPGAEATAVTSELAEVADSDLADALSTTGLPAATTASLRQSPRSCTERLAWVTLVRGRGQSPETVRLRSGNYFSPVLKLPATPVRVAIPFPGPYASGEGNLTVLGADAGLTVALTPAWSILPNTSSAMHRVTWRPSEDCKPR